MVAKLKNSRRYTQQGVRMRHASIALLLMALIIMAVACGQQEPQTTNVISSVTIYSSIEEAKTAIGESGRLIIVDFYSDT
jgi:hypothetical protein